jgi:transcriptional regulator with XRE-family HTH domain
MTGEEIKTGRLAVGLTQEQLAQKVGVAAATIQRWEAGIHSSSPLALKKLKRVLRDSARIPA